MIIKRLTAKRGRWESREETNCSTFEICPSMFRSILRIKKKKKFTRKDREIRAWTTDRTTETKKKKRKLTKHTYTRMTFFLSIFTFLRLSCDLDIIYKYIDLIPWFSLELFYLYLSFFSMSSLNRIHDIIPYSKLPLVTNDECFHS